MPDGFEVFLSQTGQEARDALSLHLRFAYEGALRSLEANPTLSNPAVSEVGDGSYMIEHRGVLLIFEFENGLVAKVFAVFAIFGW